MSTTDEQPLLPCPFCGGTPRMSIVWSVGVDDFWAGECGACEATLSGKPSQDEAATCWNRRSASESSINGHFAKKRNFDAGEPAAPVDARDALTANRDAWMAQAQALAKAAGQASFCLRTLVPDDPDAQMTVRMLNAAIARQAAAAAEGREAL